MASPAMTRFNAKYKPIADVIARADVDQTTREHLAEAMTQVLAAQRGIATPAWLRKESAGFKPSLFRLLASDPLCLCAGYGEEPCPDQLEIRVGMHLSTAPDGRSDAWSETKPIVRCVPCGAKEFMPR